MHKAARIKRLGDTLNRIDKALESYPFEMLTPEQLLSFKLKYEAALKAEYSEPPAEPATSFKDYSNRELLTLQADIYNRLKAGQITDRQARAELLTLGAVKDTDKALNPFKLEL